MMDEEFLCTSIDVIDEEIEILESKLEELYDKKAKLQELCPHNVVFRFKDSGLYKVGIVYNYVCPICNMSKRLSGYNLDDSPFNNSNIIDLDEAFVLNNEKILIKKGLERK